MYLYKSDDTVTELSFPLFKSEEELGALSEMTGCPIIKPLLFPLFLFN